MMAFLAAFSTVIFLAVFLGICLWAWSRGRQPANREAALLPFALPDEAATEAHAPERLVRRLSNPLEF